MAFPYRIHTVLTDNGMAFTGQERFRGGVTGTCIGHIFERICKFNDVEKRHTKPYHPWNPWTNGMVERMNRTIKESTIKAYEYEGLEQLREHVQAFVQSYNFGKHLKALRWKTPFRAICEAWEKDPSRFRLHPHHLTVGLNILIQRTQAGRPRSAPHNRISGLHTGTSWRRRCREGLVDGRLLAKSVKTGLAAV